jgi:hypothetical protein
MPAKKEGNLMITVADCMKLPAFEGASLVAGTNGLNHPVSSCNVLEIADPNAFRESYFAENELVITSFFVAKDDIDTQCEIIKRFKELGTVGIVLYYVGFVLTEINPRVIDIANMLDYPVITMATNRDIGYSEVINEVIEAIFLSKIKQFQYSSSILQRFSALSEVQRNYQNLIRLLGTHIKCSLSLRDQFLAPIADWCCPGMESIDLGKLFFNDLLKISLHKTDFSVRLSRANQTFYVHVLKISGGKTPSMFLFFFGTEPRIESHIIQQADETICTATEIWILNRGLKNNSLLLHSLINDNSITSCNVLSEMQNLEKWNTFWYINVELVSKSKSLNFQLPDLLTTINHFMKEQRRRAMIDSIDGSIVVLIRDEAYHEYPEDLPEALDSLFQEKKIPAKLVSVKIISITQIRSLYLSIQQGWDYVNKIFQKRRIYNQFDVDFANYCREIISQGKEIIEHKLGILHPLNVEKEIQRKELMHTLEVFMLDTCLNIADTADAIYVHNNTVKYRIKKIREILGQHIFELPASFYLQTAVALSRIIHTE